MASFVLDANLPRSVASLLGQYGHQCIDVRDCPNAPLLDPDISRMAIAQQLTILSGDSDFGDIRHYPPALHHGIVVIHRPYRSSTQMVLQIVESLMREWHLIEPVTGKLVTVELGCVRVRQ
jgi:predicted nuclease of predicted toxin-antitoxin system